MAAGDKGFGGDRQKLVLGQMTGVMISLHRHCCGLFVVKNHTFKGSTSHHQQLVSCETFVKFRQKILLKKILDLQQFEIF